MAKKKKDKEVPEASYLLGIKEAVEEIDTSKPSKKLREEILEIRKILNEKYLEIQKILLRR